MDRTTFLDYIKEHHVVKPGTEMQQYMHDAAERAMRITGELNGSYHEPEKVRELISELTGTRIDETFRMFPPFYADFGQNITIGKHVFINSGCRFQDHGGITIKDGALIGHNVVIATINHGLAPEDRAANYFAPVVIGENVWIGANATILPGVTVGDNAVVAAGAVVTKDVPAGVVAGGVPARTLKKIA